MSKEDLTKKALVAAGNMSNVARLLVGGSEFMTGRKLDSCSLVDASRLTLELRKAVDEYDKAIIDLHDK